MCGALADSGVITMRFLIISLVLLTSCCAVYKPVPMDLASIGKDIDLPGMTREEIYVKSSECLVPGTMINWINFIGRFGQFQQQALKNLQAFFRDDYSDKPFFVISTLGGSFFASRPNA